LTPAAGEVRLIQMPPCFARSPAVLLVVFASATAGVGVPAGGGRLTAPGERSGAGRQSLIPRRGITYRISHLDTAARTVRVECSVTASGAVTFALPRWVPGNYEPLPLRKHLSTFRLQVPGGAAIPLRENANEWTWHATIPDGQRATLTYTVHASEGEGSRGISQLYVGRTAAFMLPVACLVYMKGSESLPCELALQLPAGWAAAVPLPEHAGQFMAHSYEELGDSPIEMGRPGPGGLVTSAATAAGRPLRVVTSGRPAASRKTLEQVSRMAVEASASLFGSIPFPDYTVGLHAARGQEAGIAGLEHARAATMVFGGWYPLDDANMRGRGATLVFHEVFHAWNVKASRPAEFAPYQLDRPPRCRTLWFAEGFANYYGAVLPLRCGLWKSRAILYEEIAAAYSSYIDSSGRRRTSLVRASEVSYENPIYGEGDGTSYYVKGMLVGLLLDLDIRARTGGRRSLDDVMRWVYRRYPASRGGYPDDFMRLAIREAAGLDLSRECHSYLETAEELPVPERLAENGVLLTGDDKGFWRIREDPDSDATVRARREDWLHVGAASAARRGALPHAREPGEIAGASWILGQRGRLTSDGSDGVQVLVP
jgi:predicted metalloprotease with PDZ domain